MNTKLTVPVAASKCFGIGCISRKKITVKSLKVLFRQDCPLLELTGVQIHKLRYFKIIFFYAITDSHCQSLNFPGLLL